MGSFFFGLSVCGQEWHLFPEGQMNHYLDANGQLHSLRCDTILAREGIETHLFPRITGVPETCYWQNRAWLFSPEHFLIDSLVYYPDSLIFDQIFSNDTIHLSIRYNAIPGESWRFSENPLLNATCTSVGIEDILGISDSVKYFSFQTVIYGDVEFKLAKSLGLIRYIPFDAMFRESGGPAPYRELAGFENGELHKGLQIPGFSDYFHLSAGDMRLWELQLLDDSGSGDWIINYYLDSISEVTLTTDSVIYRIKRKVFGQFGHYLESKSVSERRFRSDYEVFMGTPANWEIGVADNEDSYREYTMEQITMEKENEDTVFVLYYSAKECFYEIYSSKECFIICLDKGFWDYDYAFNTVEGLTYYSQPWGRYMQLLGSLIDGELRGSMEIPVSIRTININKPVIYPNPTKNILKIKEVDLNSRIFLYNARGCLVRSGGVNEEWDLSGMPSGIYFIQLILPSGDSFVQPVEVIK